MKLRMPTQPGYENPQRIRAIHVTNTCPGEYREDRGYDGFGGG